MISEIYWINEEKIGEKKLGTMARPRGNDWLDDEIKWLKIRKVDCLVSLLEQSEQAELGLQNEGAICKKWGIEFISFPIEDVHIPKKEEAFIKLAKELATLITNSQNVVIHCRMGIGRSSILAAAIMINLGFEAGNVFEIIKTYRNLKVPDTAEQTEWILSIETKLN
ncbi:MAG: dual specificity protein phosphatase family protein [Bacteroidota bacterium]